ncbi:MAG: hypothetical protein OXU71_10570 [Gammaproteobacteria bacterium]|nr:hypothetical protein [Gammaproteobacteria bacterium]
MTPNQIESAKERINFLTRTMLAYIAGVYLLAGAVGGYLMEWLGNDELAWSEFGIIPTIAAICMAVLMAEVVRLQRKINAHIDRIGAAQ